MKKRPPILEGEVVQFVEKVFTSPSYVPYYDEYKGHHFMVVAFHYEFEENEAIRLPEYSHVELECVTGDVKVGGYVHYDEIKHVPVEQCDWTAYDFLKNLTVLPLSIEGKVDDKFVPPSNAEIRRWLDQKAVQINGKRPKAKDIIEFPVWELVFFPNGKRRTTYF